MLHNIKTSIFRLFAVITALEKLTKHKQTTIIISKILTKIFVC